MADTTDTTTTDTGTVGKDSTAVTDATGTSVADTGGMDTHTGTTHTTGAATTDTGTTATTPAATTPGTNTTETNTDTVTPTVTIDLPPPPISVKHEPRRTGLVHSNDWQKGEVWVTADRSRNLTASIPDKQNSTSVNLTDSVTGNTRTLTINELREVKTILTVSDEDKQLVNERK
ncbi:hypothetical protein [Bifidobacterium apri]|uniref:Wsc domain-containing protein 1-like protein n=1 Tax=Bifidobacterium apri TaxID=1769423 RepID=A0A6A2V5X0_9BIFI|nr:hypothetical protein [Bifidobacterium apri]KAB8292589.1 wsc domain-containing protein 1-like protein [Bifidobacterium apri]